MSIWEPEDEEGEELEELRPGDTDYDLSEQHAWSWEPEHQDGPIPRPVAILVTILVIAALIIPSIIIVLQYG